jgi:hypothetical protein
MTRHLLSTAALSPSEYAALKQAAQLRAVQLRRQAINQAIDQVWHAVSAAARRVLGKSATSAHPILEA